MTIYLVSSGFPRLYIFNEMENTEERKLLFCQIIRIDDLLSFKRFPKIIYVKTDLQDKFRKKYTGAERPTT